MGPLGSQGQIQIQSRLPTCILPDYWIRHRLSRRDIDTIISYIPTKLVWMSAMLCGLPCPWYSLRSSASSPWDITLSGKSQAVDLMLQRLGHQPSLVHKLDVDSIESFEHIPPIPKCPISQGVFDHLSSGLACQLLPRMLLGPLEPVGSIPLLYEHVGRAWVPVGLEGDAICCNAVVLETDFVYPNSQHNGYTHAPMVGRYEGVVYCLTDELVLFCVNVV